MQCVSNLLTSFVLGTESYVTCISNVSFLWKFDILMDKILYTCMQVKLRIAFLRFKQQGFNNTPETELNKKVIAFKLTVGLRLSIHFLLHWLDFFLEHLTYHWHREPGFFFWKVRHDCNHNPFLFGLSRFLISVAHPPTHPTHFQFASDDTASNPPPPPENIFWICAWSIQRDSQNLIELGQKDVLNKNTIFWRKEI